VPSSSQVAGAGVVCGLKMTRNEIGQKTTPPTPTPTPPTPPHRKRNATDRLCPRGLQKKQKNKGQKNNPKKQPTDFPSFFLFFRCPLRRLWTCHRMWSPAAGCGVFLYELVPSDGPLYLYGVFAKQYFCAAIFLFFNGFVFNFLRKINQVCNEYHNYCHTK
jgi:hypothetical protein